METAIPEDDVLVNMPHTSIINFEHPMSPVFSKLKRFSMEASLAAAHNAALDRSPSSISPTTPATSVTIPCSARRTVSRPRLPRRR